MFGGYGDDALIGAHKATLQPFIKPNLGSATPLTFPCKQRAVIMSPDSGSSVTGLFV